jgi:hypothetical protein
VRTQQLVLEGVGPGAAGDGPPTRFRTEASDGGAGGASGLLTHHRLSVPVLYQVPPPQYLRTWYSRERRLTTSRGLSRAVPPQYPRTRYSRKRRLTTSHGLSRAVPL